VPTDIAEQKTKTLHHGQPARPYMEAPRRFETSLKTSQMRLGGAFRRESTLTACSSPRSHQQVPQPENLGGVSGCQTQGGVHRLRLTDRPRVIDYAINDIETTRQCFDVLVRSYQRHRLGMTAPQGIYSKQAWAKCTCGKRR
jgi:hypothetical protein